MTNATITKLKLHFLADLLNSLPPQEGGLKDAVRRVQNGIGRLMSGEEWHDDAAADAAAAARTLAQWSIQGESATADCARYAAIAVFSDTREGVERAMEMAARYASSAVAYAVPITGDAKADLRARNLASQEELERQRRELVRLLADDPQTA